MSAASEIDETEIFVTGPVVVFKWRNAEGWPVEYASANAAEVFGYTASEFMDGAVAYGEILAAEDAPRVAEEVRNATEGGVSTLVHEPYRIRRRDGEERWLHDCTRIVRAADGAATHYLGYVVDITERVGAEREARELERRLLHAQKLESIGVLAGGIAHDFNNLLAGIVGQANLAQRALTTGKGGALAHVDQIERLAMRAADLTQQLLGYAGEGRFVVVPVDLGDLVEEMVGMLDLAISKKASLELKLELGLPAVVADRAQVQQVIMNLLTNASEALEDGPGAITVQTSLERIDDTTSLDVVGSPLPAGEYVCLAVSDTGCGIEEDVLDRIFDPFFTTKVAGRGLGMSAVLGIARGHDGAVRVRSAPGRGTTFEFLLPASDRVATRSSLVSSDEEWSAEGVALVVDDEEAVRDSASGLLSSFGFEVVRAADGEEALARLEENRAIAIILLDLTMPVMDGADTLAAIRRVAPEIPVILSSGHDARAAISRVGGEGFHFLQKPYRRAELERALRAALSDASDPTP